MITLLNGKIICGSNYESAAWAVYFMAKGDDGICESIVRKVFSERNVNGILYNIEDSETINRKHIIDMIMSAAVFRSHIVLETLTSNDVRNEVEFWLNQKDCFHIVEKDYDFVAIIAGYFSMNNPMNAITAAGKMINK